ncbi:hypothetical protein SCHPADRAFT_824512 [Schizopora paradoxa]|uniref:Inositolphosphotransferase Aur1/Ipt1 domain-containing protein n=1 Tax=Schizopora paradoxa TaxID=27342 RepID=A0A0H2S1J1_9AGAM|nr:hypothetical protein SCHPADRAFT_824512 [Schizopora paradoxa]
MSTAEHIPAFSYVAEPLLVASLLTVGCLLNRRTSSTLRLLRSPAAYNQLPVRPTHLPTFFGATVRIPDTAKYSGRLVSRFLARFPFLMEVWYWLLTYWVYQIARAMQALTMGKGTRGIAQRHAELIIIIERALHIDIELALQKIILTRPALLYFFNKTYAMVHIPATIAFFAYSYYAFPATIFQRTRRTLVLSNCLAFVIFTLWPCMPPRLLPIEEYGYVDTLHTGKAASIWTTNKFQNQLAAFPSLHFGYSWVIGVSLFVYSPSRLVRAVSLFYPLLILLVIMATANHYLLDAVGGFFVTMIAYRFNSVLLNLRPLEEWGFWLVGVEKPVEKEVVDRVTRVLGGDGEDESRRWKDEDSEREDSGLLARHEERV